MSDKAEPLLGSLHRTAISEPFLASSLFPTGGLLNLPVSRDHSHLASSSKIGPTCILDIENPPALNLPSPVKLWEAVLNGIKSSAWKVKGLSLWPCRTSLLLPCPI